MRQAVREFSADICLHLLSIDGKSVQREIHCQGQIVRHVPTVIESATSTRIPEFLEHVRADLDVHPAVEFKQIARRLLGIGVDHKEKNKRDKGQALHRDAGCFEVLRRRLNDQIVDALSPGSDPSSTARLRVDTIRR